MFTSFHVLLFFQTTINRNGQCEPLDTIKPTLDKICHFLCGVHLFFCNILCVIEIRHPAGVSAFTPSAPPCLGNGCPNSPHAADAARATIVRMSELTGHVSDNRLQRTQLLSFIYFYS
jgi:hypothetical protein